MASTKQQDAVEKMAAKYYPALWSIDALKALVAAGKLTRAAYKRVAGEDYGETE